MRLVMPSKGLDAKKRARYKKTFVKLAWRILELKFIYYKAPSLGLNLKGVSDHEYDELEDKYKKLAKILGENPTASDMVGFDDNKASCKIVMENMIRSKGKTKIEFKFKKKG